MHAGVAEIKLVMWEVLQEAEHKQSICITHADIMLFQLQKYRTMNQLSHRLTFGVLVS